MKKKEFSFTLSLILAAIAVIGGVLLYFIKPDLMWYWMLGLCFGYILQHSAICFNSATTNPIIIGTTTIFRAILIGILTASIGITAIKYLSSGELDYLGVSAISFTLMLGAFMFGIGMVVAGCCASGMFVRMGEGYVIHIVTMLCIMVGYTLANLSYEQVWSRFVIKSPVIFLPEKLGWKLGVIAHIAIIILLYIIALKWEKKQLGEFADDDTTEGNKLTAKNNRNFLKVHFSYLTGAMLLGLFCIIHFLVLKSVWSITGAFFWLSKNFDYFSIGDNLRNFGLLVGALISALACSDFKIRKIKSNKQFITSILGGLLMGYGAGIAGGCNISAFFVGASSLSLSAWVFLIFLFAGAFIGVKILQKFFI